MGLEVHYFQINPFMNIYEPLIKFKLPLQVLADLHWIINHILCTFMNHTVPCITIFTQLDSASTQLFERCCGTKWWMWWFLQAQWCSSIRGCCTERDAINTAHAPGIPCALEMGSGCVHMVLFMFYTYFIHLYSMNGLLSFY